MKNNMNQAGRLLSWLLLSGLAGNLPAFGAAPPSPIKVGLVFDLSGKNDEVADIIRGFDLALQEFKPKKGVHISTVSFDSKSNAVGTRLAMQELLKDPPDLIIAEVNSSKAFVAAEMAEAAKRFMITPLASSPSITEGKQFIFRTSYSDDFQGERLAEFAKETLKAKRAAILWDTSQLYSKTLADAFRKNFKARGGEIIVDERISPSASDFSEPLRKLANQNVDLVFLPTYEELAARVLNQAGRLGIKTHSFLGGDGWYPRLIFSDLINSKHFSFDLYWVEQFEPDSKNPAIRALIQKTEAKLGRKINASMAQGYDTGLLVGKLVEAIGKAGPLDQMEVVRAIARLPKFQGLTTQLSFGKDHNPSKPLFIHKLVHENSVLFKEIKP